MENKKLFSTFWGRSWEFGRQKVVMEIFGGKKTIRKSGTCVWVFFECRTPCQFVLQDAMISTRGLMPMGVTCQTFSSHPLAKSIVSDCFADLTSSVNIFLLRLKIVISKKENNNIHQCNINKENMNDVTNNFTCPELVPNGE
ncbi:hypothetical protein OUZ56_020371 [Daphnia magna]|uniref:Uncharacterized protein n=1 Tax=Daphnia magna TaxID=35525 RepID=A0ABQ9ZF21_9CRUS|nr:hypothetical protein OUZ56_020371 [Daphnia magna]